METKKEGSNPGLFTTAVQASHGRRPVARAPVAPSPVFSTSFAFDTAEQAAAAFQDPAHALIYSRWRNPTVERFEQGVALLEGAAAGVALSSGMAAVSAVLDAFLVPGDHVVAPVDMYSGTRHALLERSTRGIETSFVDMRCIDRVKAAVRPSTKLVFVESPANPTLGVTDIAAVKDASSAARVVADNTFATPIHQCPLALGADLVLHSATKALCGHGDAIGGVVVGSDADVERVRNVGVKFGGSVLAPFNAWLMARALSTLPLRQQRSSATAAWLAQELSERAEVQAVHYPGLLSHPDHALASRQMQRGFGAMLSFELEGGRNAGARLYDQVTLLRRAVSLGDCQSLITHPASTTHASLSAEERARAGIGEGLVRLSIGLEDPEDLLADLVDGFAPL